MTGPGPLKPRTLPAWLHWHLDGGTAQLCRGRLACAFCHWLFAVLFTGFMFITRKISKHIEPVDLQAANGVCAMVILLPIAAFGSAWGIPSLTIIPVTGF